jgi:hypothetical protein
MSFTAGWETTIQAAYLQVLKIKYPNVISGKILECDTFGIIVEKFKSVLIDSSNRGLTVLETANEIIFNLLHGKFFKYEKHQTALFIGYLYLVRQGVKINNYSVGTITDDSTLDEIRALTVTW